MEIRIGIQDSFQVGPQPYYWIGNQGFMLQPCQDIEAAEWTLNQMKKAFETIPGVTIKRIEGYKWYGGV